MPGNPGDFVSVEWQRVGRYLRRWRQNAGIDPTSRWLVQEFIAYLKEEGLADEEALTPSHVFTFAARPAADRAIARVIELANQYVEENWGPRHGFAKTGGSTPLYGPKWYCNHDVVREGDGDRPATWRDTHFEWTFREDSSRAEARDGLAFFAGATFVSKESPLYAAANREWIAALASQGFERVQDYYWRLWRVLYPEQLMIDQSLEAQGLRLGKWVVDCFEALAAKPPPS